MVSRPVAGSVMRLKIFNSVLFSAPLRPMMTEKVKREKKKVES
jgi:hypothetical protein